VTWATSAATGRPNSASTFSKGPADLLDDLVQRGGRLRVVAAAVAGDDLHAGQQVAGVRTKAFRPGLVLQFLERRPHGFQYQG
jgi:hypothetical protein